MADIQKVLPTDTFGDMVTHVNAVIDGHNSLVKSVTDLYKVVQSSRTEVTPAEMNNYLNSLYS